MRHVFILFSLFILSCGGSGGGTSTPTTIDPPTKTCGYPGASCKANSDCCADQKCSAAGVCTVLNPQPTICVSQGSVCSDKLNCCSGLSCNSDSLCVSKSTAPSTGDGKGGVPGVCDGLNASCVTANQTSNCCGDYVCTDGKCVDK